MIRFYVTSRGILFGTAEAGTKAEAAAKAGKLAEKALAAWGQCIITTKTPTCALPDDVVDRSDRGAS